MPRASCGGSYWHCSHFPVCAAAFRHGIRCLAAPPLWDGAAISCGYSPDHAQAASVQVWPQWSNLNLRLKLVRGSRKVESIGLSFLFRPAIRYQGFVSAALVLGGVDIHGPHLFTVRTAAAALCCAPLLLFSLEVCCADTAFPSITPVGCVLLGVPTWFHRLLAVCHDGVRQLECHVHV